MTPDIHHEVARVESEAAATAILQPHTVAIKLQSGEVVVGGQNEEDPEQ